MDWFTDMGWLFMEWVIWIAGAGAMALAGGWILWHRPHRQERAQMSATIADLERERRTLLARLQEAERRGLATGS